MTESWSETKKSVFLYIACYQMATKATDCKFMKKTRSHTNVFISLVIQCKWIGFRLSWCNAAIYSGIWQYCMQQVAGQWYRYLYLGYLNIMNNQHWPALDTYNVICLKRIIVDPKIYRISHVLSSIALFYSLFMMNLFSTLYIASNWITKVSF